MLSIKNAALALIAASTVATAVPAAAATASHGPSAVVATQWQGWDDDHWEDRRDWRNDRRDWRDNRRDWRDDRRGWRGDRASWRGDEGRFNCRRVNGTTGLIVGGAAGALLGPEVAGRGGDRTLGAVLGAAGGALLGREVDRGGSRCR